MNRCLPLRANQVHDVGVADQIATRFGMLNRELSHAVLRTIALTARDGVAALAKVHRRLGSLNVQDGYSRSETPEQRWREMLEDLFPAATVLVIDMSGSDMSLENEFAINPAEERTIRSLLLAAATFLLSETMKLEEQIDLWTVVDADVQGFDELEAVLLRASKVSQTLLNHAEEGTWRQLLIRKFSATPASNSRIDEIHAIRGKASTRMVLAIHEMPGSRLSHSGAALERLTEVIKKAKASRIEVEIYAAPPNGRRGSDLLGFLRRWVHELPTVTDVNVKTSGARGPVTLDSSWSATAMGLASELHAVNSIVKAAKPQRLFLIVPDNIDEVQDSSAIVGLRSLGRTPDRDSLQKFLESLREQQLLPDLRNVEVDVVGVDERSHESFWRKLLMSSGAQDINFVRTERAESPPSSSFRMTENQLTPQQARMYAFVDIVDDPGRTRRAALMVAALSVPAILTVLILGLVAVKSGIAVGAAGVGGLIGVVIALSIRHVLPMSVAVKRTDKELKSRYRRVASRGSSSVNLDSSSLMSTFVS